MNELHFGSRVRTLLDRRLTDIDAGQLDRLRQARERALAVQKQPAPQPALAAAGRFARLHVGSPRSRLLLAAGALLAATWLVAYWHADGLIDELSEVDTALLADDVPVEALLDAGFESWLGDSH